MSEVKSIMFALAAGVALGHWLSGWFGTWALAFACVPFATGILLELGTYKS
jgi:predicted MFS family arabinose efflux permease